MHDLLRHRLGSRNTINDVRMKNVLVAGAGIIGASIGYHLAKSGAGVTLVDARHPAAGASGKSFGWINATFSKRPRAYYDLSLAGIEGWHRLETELAGALEIQWGGSVAWLPPGTDAEALREDIASHQRWGYAARLVQEPELRRQLPNVSFGEVGIACHCQPEGALDPVDATSALLDHARRCGATIHYPCEVTGFDLDGTRIRAVHTTQGAIQADAVVLACGIDSPQLARLAGVSIPLKDAPGALVHTAPQPALIDCIAIAPEVHFKQDARGRIIIGGQLVAGAGTAAAPLAGSDQIFREATRYLPALRDAAIEQVTLGYRVMPQDEYPILGFSGQCPNLYVAATHSGVTLAPVIGQVAAEEILDGIPKAQLAAYRLARFT
jgi:glycine/D-amino acid oxidase-like deaminating enzyme